MVVKKCEYEGCSWSEEASDLGIYLGLLKIHVEAVHVHPPSSGTAKPAKAKRPELAADVSDEDWHYFLSRWADYKKATNLSTDDLVIQLMECCSEELRRDHHRMFLSAAKPEVVVSEETRLAELKQIAVQKTQ